MKVHFSFDFNSMAVSTVFAIALSAITDTNSVIVKPLMPSLMTMVVYL